jgi:hypothetical protein
MIKRAMAIFDHGGSLMPVFFVINRSILGKYVSASASKKMPKMLSFPQKILIKAIMLKRIPQNHPVIFLIICLLLKVL